jgi:hypothetical protein
MKARHEEAVAQVLSTAQPWRRHWNIIYYLNIPRLSMFAAMSGVSLNIPVVREFKFLHELG